MQGYIKIGRNEIEIKKDDYIMFNGSVYQFIAGDMRTLIRKGFESHNILYMPKSIIKKIDFSKLNKIDSISSGKNITKWFF